MKVLKNLVFPALIAISFFAKAMGAEVPEVLGRCFTLDKPVKAEAVTIVPPKEYEQFIQQMSEAARKDPEWFEEYTAKSSSGSPFPGYDEKLGMTKEEYDNYVKLWGSREVKRIADIVLLLEEVGDNEWKISASGVAAPLSLLRYSPEKDVFVSPNGELERIADVKASEESLLGAWSGNEWRYQTSNSLTTLRENIAFGMTNDKKYSYLIYRLQEIVTKSGKPLADQRLIIRFAAKPAN